MLLEERSILLKQWVRVRPEDLEAAGGTGEKYKLDIHIRTVDEYDYLKRDCSAYDGGCEDWADRLLHGEVFMKTTTTTTTTTTSTSMSS